MEMSRRYLHIKLLLLLIVGSFVSNGQLTITIAGTSGEPVVAAHVLTELGSYITDMDGQVTIETCGADLRLKISHIGYSKLDTTLTASTIRAARAITLTMMPLMLRTVEVDAADTTFKSVDRFTIYAAKKIDIIAPTEIVCNSTTGSARQLFRSVPGLNIWENGDGGLQLSIGGRGMNPNRSSNFNTRQNGYDISADPLGYPESYYTPSMQALSEIQIMRGAASLQFGPQFGGMINFRLLEPSETQTWSIKSEQGISSFGLQSSFNAIGFRKNGWETLFYYHHRRGDGWRENSSFRSNQGHVNIGKRFKSDFIKFEYTYSNSLAQQPGGLTDVQFNRTPSLALRQRNWFEVDWHLFSATYEHLFNQRTKWQVQPYMLIASRSALGILDKITRADTGGERDLIQGTFNNVGIESRLSIAYDVFGSISNFIGGVRVFRGHTTAFQGLGSSGSDADFSRGSGISNNSDFDFHNHNYSFFGENIIRHRGWTFTPGLRYEFIGTQSEGRYSRVAFDGAGNLLPTYPRNYTDGDQRNRRVFLYGLGIQKELRGAEWYASATKNYRAINFSDIRIINPNQLVDSAIHDEKGFTLETGVRKKLGKFVGFDLNLFQVEYNDKIGNISDTATLNPTLGAQTVQIRKNISSARIQGLELTASANLYFWKSTLQLFSNVSLLKAKYAGEDSPQTDGNYVEYAPRATLRGGFTFEHRWIAVTWMSNYVSDQFSDASNSPFGSDPFAVVGAIPAFNVHDLAIQLTYKKFRLTAGVDNVTDMRYFTRRASGYPGPGIIPADPRTMHIAIAFIQW